MIKTIKGSVEIPTMTNMEYARKHAAKCHCSTPQEIEFDAAFICRLFDLDPDAEITEESVKIIRLY